MWILLELSVFGGCSTLPVLPTLHVLWTLRATPEINWARRRDGPEDQSDQKTSQARRAARPEVQQGQKTSQARRLVRPED